MSCGKVVKPTQNDPHFLLSSEKWDHLLGNDQEVD